MVLFLLVLWERNYNFSFFSFSSITKAMSFSMWTIKNTNVSSNATIATAPATVTPSTGCLASFSLFRKLVTHKGWFLLQSSRHAARLSYFSFSFPHFLFGPHVASQPASLGVASSKICLPTPLLYTFVLSSLWVLFRPFSDGPQFRGEQENFEKKKSES